MMLDLDNENDKKEIVGKEVGSKSADNNPKDDDMPHASKMGKQKTDRHSANRITNHF